MKNIVLRPIEPNDLDFLYRLENDPENWVISGTSTPFSKNTLKNYIFSIQDIFTDKQLRLIIVDINNKEVGVLDFFEFDQKNSRVGIGIIVCPEYRNLGIGKIAVKKAIQYCFETLLIHQIFCSIVVSNAASIQLFESLEFKKCGVKKDWIKTSKGWVDVASYQLINSL